MSAPTSAYSWRNWKTYIQASNGNDMHAGALKIPGGTLGVVRGLEGENSGYTFNAPQAELLDYV